MDIACGTIIGCHPQNIVTVAARDSVPEAYMKPILWLEPESERKWHELFWNHKGSILDKWKCQKNSNESWDALLVTVRSL